MAVSPPAEVKCSFPLCPSGVNVKLLDDRHEEIKNHFKTIESNQQRLIELVADVASLLTNVDNIKGDIKLNEKEHDEMFTRLRKVEGRVVWMLGGGAGVIAILQVLRTFNVIK